MPVFLALNVNYRHDSHTNIHLPLQPFFFFLHPIISHLRFSGSGYKIRFDACSRVVCWFLQQLTSEPDKQKHLTYRTYMTVQVCAPMRVSICHNHEGMAAFTHSFEAKWVTIMSLFYTHACLHTYAKAKSLKHNHKIIINEAPSATWRVCLTSKF